jgi:hypothetical protein
MTRDEIIEIARKSWLCIQYEVKKIGLWGTRWEDFANLVAAKEREACAKVVDDIEARCIAKDVDDPPLNYVAAAIRARGEQA